MKKLLLLIVLFHLPAIILVEQILAQDSVKAKTETSFFNAIRANQAESYITFGQGLGNIEPLIFESLIAPYFLLRTSHDARLGATLSPAILIRMQAEESFPVRSPSYMPNITFYRQLRSTFGEKYDASYLFLMLEHHSNGQDGEFYNEDDSYNIETGNFATNLIEFGIFINRNLLPFQSTTEYFRTSVELHPNIGREDELNGKYSFLRWNNSFRILRIPGQRPKPAQSGHFSQPQVQTRVETAWLFGNINHAAFFNLKERFNFSATIAYRPKALRDVSFFLNFYTGKDYYNMQFYRRINTLRIGLQAFAFK
ncbi:MAG: hypothetical protein GX102_09150 [Porphyromonadaceae bacterium]|nr:hypothetical protein [Porphyromonadaceae bacterium]